VATLGKDCVLGKEVGRTILGLPPPCEMIWEVTFRPEATRVGPCRALGAIRRRRSPPPGPAVKVSADMGDDGAPPTEFRAGGGGGGADG